MNDANHKAFVNFCRETCTAWGKVNLKLNFPEKHPLGEGLPQQLSTGRGDELDTDPEQSQPLPSHHGALWCF